MVSKRPWSLVGLADKTSVVLDADGRRVAVCEIRPDADHIVACVNAFHECGIEPGDLRAFVEAVRAWYRLDLSSAGPALNAAAALLPENRGGNVNEQP